MRAISRPISTATPAAWMAMVFAASGASAVATPGGGGTDLIPRAKLSEIFRRYDFDPYELDNVECLEDMEYALCPPAEIDFVPCSSEITVNNFCRSLLGEKETEEGGDVETKHHHTPAVAKEGEGSNALTGCINYVSWDTEKLSCCPSDFCSELTRDEEEPYWDEWELVRDDEDEEEGYVYEYAEELRVIVEDVDYDYDDDFDLEYYYDEDDVSDSNRTDSTEKNNDERVLDIADESSALQKDPLAKTSSVSV